MAPITRNDLQRLFKNLDKDNNGQVSIHDLQNLLDLTGIIHTTTDDLEKLVGQESLNYADFLFFYESMIKAGVVDHPKDRDLVEAFKVFDLNGDGFITSEELERALSRMGLLKGQSGQDCKDMIDAYDENSDGVLDFQEFKNMMTVPPADYSDTHTYTH